MRVYIAGPYGDHNPPEVIAVNVARADAIARELVLLGHDVYVPHKMTWHWEQDKRLTGKDFTRLDYSFMLNWAEAVLRLPGESKGADEEVGWAREQELKVFNSIADLQAAGRVVWIEDRDDPEGVTAISVIHDMVAEAVKQIIRDTVAKSVEQIEQISRRSET